MTAFPMALPLRAMVSITSPVARPVSPEKHAHTSAPAIASGTRRRRSAIWAIGTWRASAATLDTATIDSIAVQVEPELVADLGKEDAEGGAVELVDGVEAEQDDERIGGFAGTDAA